MLIGLAIHTISGVAVSHCNVTEHIITLLHILSAVTQKSNALANRYHGYHFKNECLRCASKRAELKYKLMITPYNHNTIEFNSYKIDL